VVIGNSLFKKILFMTRPVADQLLREVYVLASDVNRKYVPGTRREVASVLCAAEPGAGHPFPASSFIPDL
jgi:hypothetical protein